LQALSELSIGKLAVFGVGLIGGSFAAALKSAGMVQRVAGVGRSRGNLERALALGLIDEIAEDAAGALAGADLALVAVPVQQTEAVLEQIAAHFSPACVVTDAGSTKQDVVAAARRALGPGVARFVPAHPIAGAELSGAEAASATLYRDRLVVLTPLPETEPGACSVVETLWRGCGARPVQMTPQRHDEVFAAVSHLPHALAFALVHMLAGRADAQQLFALAGAGFRDFTRIAGSSPEMWRDICLANRDALGAEIAAFQHALAALASHLERGDGQAVERLFEAARVARGRWLQGVE
jgi:prephenate dehydrogenase